MQQQPLNLQRRRPPSPQAPPLLRGPSPLGRGSLVFREDGTVEGVPPPRAATAPPTQPAPIRPPSPGSASSPLRPPVKQARRNSRRELQKIDCAALQLLLEYVISELQRLVRALIKIMTRISRQWTVPQRVARTAVRDIALRFTTNASYLIKYLGAVSSSSRQILNFVATCIRETHGLRDFAHTQDIKPVIDELRLLHSHWAALTKSEGTFGDLLGEVSLTLEAAADPDNWVTGSPVSNEMKELADAHHSIEQCFTRVADYFKDLTLSSWQPPLLSPEDVKTAAGKWKDVEATALQSMAKVRTAVKTFLETAVSCAFMPKEDGEKMLAIVLTSEHPTGGTGIKLTRSGPLGASLPRSASASGWRGG